MNSNNSTPHLAAKYDLEVLRTIPYYALFHEETINLIRAMQIKPSNWLDTGCGTGTFAEKALAAFPNTVFVLSDPSNQMLLESKKKLVNVPSTRLKFLESATTQDLVENKERFQVITAIQSHHYLSRDERIKATLVCFKLLTLGGVYVTFENIRPFTKEGTEIGKKYWKLFQLAQGRNDETVEKHLRRFDSEYFPITVEEHLTLLRKAGFSTVEMLWFSYLQAGFYCIK